MFNRQCQSTEFATQSINVEQETHPVISGRTHSVMTPAHQLSDSGEHCVNYRASFWTPQAGVHGENIHSTNTIHNTPNFTVSALLQQRRKRRNN